MPTQAPQFEPVYLQPVTARPTEYGKRYFDERSTLTHKHGDVLADIAKLALIEQEELERQGGWDAIERLMLAEGIPTCMASGISQYAMHQLIDHLNGKTSFTMPSTVAMAAGSAAPSVTTTGVWGTAETTNYTGYLREAIAGSGFVAATTANPSVATNNGAITFPACTASNATWLGFLITDNSTINTGDALWYGSLLSVTISTTQTPPTVASGALSLSLTGS